MKRVFPTVVRILLGLMFAGAAIAGMLGKVPPPEPEAARDFMGMIFASGLLYLVKVTELLCGLALLSGFFVPLALVVIAPVIVNIAFFHASLDPAGLVVSAVLIALWTTNAWFHRAELSPLLRARTPTV
jgi:uncharacterized membrane protein YphA (DoxX/SURF4 family)